MSKFRTIKTHNILNSDEYINQKKNKSLFETTKTKSTDNDIYKNKSGCLKATGSYDILYSLIKGNNLILSKKYLDFSGCPTPITDISYINTLHGQMNEANIINMNTKKIHLVDPSTNIMTPSFINTIPKPSIERIVDYPQIQENAVILIDPSKNLFNKISCEPYIFIQDPSNNAFYDISTNGIPISNNYYYRQILLANSQYPNLNFSSNINFSN